MGLPEDADATAWSVNGHVVSYFHLEQQFKGNYLLQATIDGRHMRYIIRKGTAEHYSRRNLILSVYKVMLEAESDKNVYKEKLSAYRNLLKS